MSCQRFVFFISKKFIFITGGVASSLGKGLAAASIAGLLERRGLKVRYMQIGFANF